MFADGGGALPIEFDRPLEAASGRLGGGIIPPGAPYGPGLIDRPCGAYAVNCSRGGPRILALLPALGLPGGGGAGAIGGAGLLRPPFGVMGRPPCGGPYFPGAGELRPVGVIGRP